LSTIEVLYRGRNSGNLVLEWFDRKENAERLAGFMGYFGGSQAREIARLTGWKDKVWARRYTAILRQPRLKCRLKCHPNPVVRKCHPNR
jgi:hypothetical protein